MARKEFNDHEYHGGRVTDDPLDDKPARMRYPCAANQCPMPGTIFPGNTRSWVCVYHCNAHSGDWPRITQILLDWQCVTSEINAARRALTGESARDPVAIDAAFAAGWQRLEPLAGDWAEQLRPGNIRVRGVESRHRESYGDWANRLTEFIGGRVLDGLTKRAGAAR